MGDPSFGPTTDVMPDPAAVVVAYINATLPTLDGRVATAMDAGNHAWPFVRVTLLNAYPIFPRVLDRYMVQVDCFSPEEPHAYETALAVRAALVGCAGWTGEGASLSGSQELSLRPIPDETFTPPIARVSVAGYVFARNYGGS